jgi:hypothetical protein
MRRLYIVSYWAIFNIMLRANRSLYNEPHTACCTNSLYVTIYDTRTVSCAGPYLHNITDDYDVVHSKLCEPGSSVGTVSDYGLDDRGSIPDRGSF